MVSLETKGRRTRRILRVPLVVAELEGRRYLVSMLGENADWVRNVRASNGEAVLRHGVTEPVKLQEVEVSKRPPILRAFLKRAPGARPHFDIAPDASVEEFARIAPRVPVFRVLPDDRPASRLRNRSAEPSSIKEPISTGPLNIEASGFF
jgi:hypothetical protein